MPCCPTGRRRTVGDPALELTSGSSSRPRHRGRRIPGLIVHRVGARSRDEIVVIEGVRVTRLSGPRWTWRPCVPDDHMDRALERMIELGSSTRRAGGGPGSAIRAGGVPGRLGAASSGCVPPRRRAPRELERRALNCSATSGLASPQVNALVEGSEVDLSWPERRVVVELDSHAFHRRRALRARPAQVGGAGGPRLPRPAVHVGADHRRGPEWVLGCIEGSSARSPGCRAAA